MSSISSFPAALVELAEQVRHAAEHRTPLRIAGRGTRSFLGDASHGSPLSTLELRGITDYQPSELVVTALAGTPLQELEAALAERRQCLAFEPPRFGATAVWGGTVGGMVAAGLSGPGRMAGGALREAVLGAVVLDGQAQGLRFGGQVIKNVAGYDVSRLLAGSLGTLGVILEVSLRVAPLPAAIATRRFEMPQAQAIEQVNRWLGQALPVHASAWHEGILHVRLQGAQAAVREAETSMGGETLAPERAEAFWEALRDHGHPLLAPDHPLPLWRLALPPTHGPLALPGSMLVEWHGGQRWLRSDLPAASLRAAAHEAGGHATRWHTGHHTANPGDSAFTPLAEPVASIERRLKLTFDPHDIFNPGRRPFQALAA